VYKIKNRQELVNIMDKPVTKQQFEYLVVLLFDNTEEQYHCSHCTKYKDNKCNCDGWCKCHPAKFVKLSDYLKEGE